MARLSGQSLGRWTEPPVSTFNSGDTYPYPGITAMTGRNYFEQDLTLYEFPAGRAKNRRAGDSTVEAYAHPQYATPVAKVLKDDYQVIN